MNSITNQEEFVRQRIQEFDLERMYNGYFELLHCDFDIVKSDNFVSIMQKIGTKFNSLLPGLHQYGAFFEEYSEINPLNVFRTVAHKKRPESIRDGYYNPNVKKIRLNRCNFPNQQVFYCSESSGVSIEETEMHEDEHMLLGEWILKRQNSTVFYLFGHSTDVMFKKFREEMNAKYSGDELVKRIHLSNICTQLLLGNNRLISSYIAYKYFSHGGSIAIRYPSVKFLQAKYNYACNKQFADKNISASNFYYGIVKRKDEKYFIGCKFEGLPALNELIIWDKCKDRSIYNADGSIQTFGKI